MEIIGETAVLEKDVNKITDILQKMITEKIDLEQKIDELKENDVQKMKSLTSLSNKCYFDLILEKIFNYYLSKISKLKVKDYYLRRKEIYLKNIKPRCPTKYSKALHLIDGVLECCDPTGKYSEVYEDAEYIVDNLIKKTLKVNDFAMIMPVKIEYIKAYCISSNTLSTDIDNEIWYMIIYLATSYYVLSQII